MVRHIPLSVMASWPTPNYVDPVRRGPAAVNVTVVFMSFVTAAVFLRLYIHIFVIRLFGPGDVFIILSFRMLNALDSLICLSATSMIMFALSTIAMTALEIVGYEQYDWGRHIWDVPLRSLSQSVYISWWYRIVYCAAACFTRTALIFFYYRLTQGGRTQKSFRRWIHAVAVFSAAVGLTLIVVTIFQCSPIRAMWTYPAIKSKCVNEGIMTFICGIINTIADIAVVVLPIPLIYKLRLPLKCRVSAMFLVSLGFLVCVVGAVRSYFVWLSLIHSYDETWDGMGTLVAATIEIHVGLICACAPAIRVGWKKLIKPRLAFLHSGRSTKLSSTKVSSGKLSFPLTRNWGQKGSNSGTHLPSAMRNSFDDAGYFEMTSKETVRQLGTVDGFSYEKGFHFNETRPITPPNDQNILSPEIQEAHEPGEYRHDQSSSLQRWQSADTAVEYAESMVFPRRSEIVRSPMTRNPASVVPDRLSYIGLTREELVGVGVPSNHSTTNTSSNRGDTASPIRETTNSPSSRERLSTLPIPERAFKLTRE